MNNEKQIFIEVIYCGAWGYSKKYKKLEKSLRAVFPDESKVVIKGTPTPGVTGKFEVIVNGKTIHSKIGGQGFVDDDKKVQAVIEAINKEMLA